MKITVRYGISRAFTITVVLSVIIFISSPWIMTIFTENEAILAIGTKYLKLISIIYPLISIGMNVGRTLQGLGYGMPQLIITLTRVLIVSVPLAILFTQVMGKPVEWVWYSMMVSSVVAITISVIWLRSVFQKLIPAT